MSELVECVPNLSEGCRPDVIDAVAAAVSDIPGAALLDRSSDADHNRTVLTLAGTAAGLIEAIRGLYAAAIPRIDLRQHDGKHPRIGVVDVAPFIPIQNVTMADCVALSRTAGAMIAAEFGVPVYLYAESATAENRRRLPDIRKGGFEELAHKMSLPEWRPDYGPTAPHLSAGATAVGARFFLIAYNVQLDTPDIRIAAAVAKAVRASSGGFPAVQAMGVFLASRNQAQVSTNLLDYRITPLRTLHEAIRREAARHGARISGSELIGLIPQAALDGASAEELQIEGFTEGRILERAIERNLA